jgi:hypothetical protein
VTPGENPRAYDYNNSDCRPVHYSDPVNVIFYGSGAGYIHTANEIRDQSSVAFPSYMFTDPGPPRSGSEYFSDGTTCSDFDTDLADHANSNPSGRYHIRLEAFPPTQSRNGHKTVGTAAHADWVWRSPGNPNCTGFLGNIFGFGNHAVDKGTANQPTPNGSGFDQGRRRIKQMFRDGNPHHDFTVSSYGNTVPKKQCDGDYAGSDGNVLHVRLGRTE